jgi:uncharacterized protein YjbI with pentapeptide repeats
MANRKQLAILKQGVAAWNKWREENPDAKINLRGAKLDELDLSGVNFSKADIRGVSFKNAMLTRANFSESILGIEKGTDNVTDFTCSELAYATFDNIIVKDLGILCPFHVNVKFSYATLDYTSWKNFQAEAKKNSLYDNGMFVNSFEYIDVDHCFKNTKLADHNIRKLLRRGKGQRLCLKGKDLKRTRLVNFDLRDKDLRETDLRQANLSGTDITGAKLWGSAREGWIIDGIRCDYVYWDEAGEVRTPPARDFRPGEFEELYKQLPSFEYVFAQGFTPLDPLIMDRVVQAINEQHKEFSLELVNFDKRGEPHATFTVCRLDYVEKAKEQITAGYEASKGSPEQQAQLMAAVLGLIENQSKLIDKIPSPRELTMGDTYNISGGQIGAIGQHASASGNTFQQITAELSRLHEAMRNAAANPAQNAAADEVAKAEQAAKQQNEPKMRQHLKNAGKFALDCAKTIGTDVAAEYLKKMTLGM